MTQTKKASKPKNSSKKPVKTARKPAGKKPARKPKEPKELPKIIRYCSFCGKSQYEVMALIAGPNNIFICDNCVEVCTAILFDDENPDKNTPKIWRQRITDLLSNPNKFDILTIDETKKGKESKGN